MKVLVVLGALIAASQGVGVKWRDFRGGDLALATTEEDALNANYIFVEKDSQLKITWYTPTSDCSFSVAYDKKGHLAGTRITVLESSIESKYLSLYKQSRGIFKKTKVSGNTAYKSTVLFTDERILKSGGRQMYSTEEVALGVYLEVKGKYTRLSREGCVVAQTFQEQSCQSAYGVVFTAFGRKSKCEALIPFYAVYDPVYDGDLTGFGWLSFHKETNGESFFKRVTSEYIKFVNLTDQMCLAALKLYGLAAFNGTLYVTTKEENALIHNILHFITYNPYNVIHGLQTSM